MEVWKVIEEFPDYMISDQGRIKSLKFGKEKILELQKNGSGYLQVDLWKNEKYTKTVHRLVLENFDPIENMNKFECNHINGNKENNKFPENIEWCTPSENIKHAFKIGLKNHKGKNHPMYGKHHTEETKKKQSEKAKGENNPRSILTEEKVIKIWKDLKEGILTQKQIGEKFGVGYTTISDIKNKKRWKNLNIEGGEKICV